MPQEVTRIKKRIKSVSGSYKITSAMKLVSTVKLKKWKNKMLANKEYASKIDEIAETVFSHIEKSNNPFFQKRKADKNLYIVLSSSLGLCGAYNNNIFRLAEAKIKANDEAIILGKKAISHYKDGTFKKKDAKYSGETTNYVFSDDFGFSFKSNEIEDEINKVCRELIDNGAPAQAVNYLRARTFLNWMEKSKGERLFDLKRLVMTLNMYIK